MKIIAYFGFTLLSILIQFCVMDFIQERMQENKVDATSQKKRFRDIIKKLNDKPHALFLRTTEKLTEKIRLSSAKTYSNVSLLETTLDMSTETSTTAFEVLYDDNVSVTDNYFTTETLFTTTEYDNTSELSLFNKNHTIYKTSTIPKDVIQEKCDCNLLFKVCDINCCCDNDCTPSQRETFHSCVNAVHTERSDSYCYSQLLGYEQAGGLFCIAKSNLPDRRTIIDKYDASMMDQVAEESFKWHSFVKTDVVNKFAKKPYVFNDPMWYSINGTLDYVDLPSPAINNYCSNRKPMEYLKEENYNCIVKIKDLEMFQIIKNSEIATLLSVADESLNSTVLNCSTVHCTNWTILFCDETSCVDYNRSVHEPSCTDNVCIHLTPKVEYIFNCYDNKIINATVKLYTQKVSIAVPFIMQTINVKFYYTNESSNQIVELSGNPGYVSGLPVIVSFADGNHTRNFYNYNSTRNDKYLLHPHNERGVCELSNLSNNFVRFGSNRRVRCRYSYERDTDACKGIDNNLKVILNLNRNVFVCPFGNPKDVSDDAWLPMRVHDDVDNRLIDGVFNEQQSSLRCFNVVTRVALVFTYADVSEVAATVNNKILSAQTVVTRQNVTFSADDVSAAIAVDVSFVGVASPAHEYVGAPRLNINLPKDFFFPFPSNISNVCEFNVCVMLILLLIVKCR